VQGIGHSLGGDSDASNTSVTGAGTPHVLFTSAPELQRGDVLGGRFQIEAVIGSGGSGRVLRAFDRESRMLVALKILRPEFAEDPVWAERFTRELRVGRTITHPNVCRVFDIGDADGHKFLSMELAGGGCIRTDVPKAHTPDAPKSTRTWDERVADARAVVAGVAALHAAGIVHRDIKPENILRMDDGRLVVTDFGLATDPGSGPGNTVMVGTPSYMAPEVVMGDPATLCSDVWGMGVVLHEILFGGRPVWKAAGRGYRRFVLPPVTTPSERAVAELCGRCVSEVPEVRPATAVDLQQALDVALRGKRVMSRRRRWQLGWGAVALASLSSLGLVRERWTNSARASSAAGATPLAERVLTPTGTPADWSKGATKLATFAGRLHCYSLVDGGKKVRAIWGTPRKAEDVDVKTGERTPSDLLPETYRDGCPVVSPDGKSLLFEKVGDMGTRIFMTDLAGGPSREVVRGTTPAWLPNSQEFAFGLDARHAAIFSLPTGQMTLVSDEVGGQFQVEGMAVDRTGLHLAVVYGTDSRSAVLVVHALPGLEVTRRISLPLWSRDPQFGASPGQVLFSAYGDRTEREILSADLGTPSLTRSFRVQGADARGLIDFGPGRLLVTRQLRFDLYLHSAESGNRLTTDGHSLRGSLSGDRTRLVVQRVLDDGREVIVLRDEKGVERQMTVGPRDVAPSFLPDGSAWVHSRLDRGELVRCSVWDGHCSVAHRDPLIPGLLSVDPSGQRVAYVTTIGVSRVRTVSLVDSSQRDLGPTGACRPVWSSLSRLWVATSDETRSQTWAEIDVDAGVRTGKTLTASSDLETNDCPLPIEFSHVSPVLGLVEESAELIGPGPAQNGGAWATARTRVQVDKAGRPD